MSQSADGDRELFPRTSSDERDPDAGREAVERDQWLRDNVPPHHR